jgi:predicted PurR-regulated permease PerM
MTDFPPSESLTSNPKDPAMRFQRAALLLLVGLISVLFFKMVAGFMVAVLLAAIFAGMSYPFYRRLRVAFGGRQNLASTVTILALLLGVVVPLSAFLALVVSESVSLSQSVQTWLRSGPDRMQQLEATLARIPLVSRLIPQGEELVAQLSDLASRAGPIVAGQAAAFGKGTLSFLLQLFVCLYAMFFFLVDGPGILRQILYYIPLDADDEAQLLERFVSVTRATLKGSLLIGVLQGTLAGLAFWVCGVPAPAFWGTVMVVLSIIPAIGAAFVWVPAVIFLFATGESSNAIGLLAWCAVVVSTIDNFLRPRLIGRDARMSDLLILISTLGGISVFGALGFIVGPIIAALFVTVWHIYGDAFSDWLPSVPAGFLRTQTFETVAQNQTSDIKE